MGLFPQGFVVETSSAGEFIKLPEAGASLKLLPLGGFAAGYEYWTESGQCIRSTTKFTETPHMRKLNKFGKPETVKQWVALSVYNYEDKTAGVLYLTQKALTSAIQEADKEHDLSLGQVALKITTVKNGQQINYTLMPIPLQVVKAGQVVQTEIGSQTPAAELLSAMASEIDLDKLTAPVQIKEVADGAAPVSAPTAANIM